MAMLLKASIAFLIGTFLYIIFENVSYKRRMKGARPPPGPKGWPIVGNAPELASSDGNLIPMFNKWAREYGPLVQFSLLGEKQVVISDDNIARELFVKRSAKYSDRGTPYAMKYLTMDSNPALMPKNEAWRRERKLIHSAISITANEKYQHIMLNEAKATLHALLQNPVEFDAQFCRYAYSVLTNSMLGFSVDSVDHEFIQENEAYVDEAMKCFRPDEHPANVFPFLRKFPGWLVPSLGKMEAMRREGVESRGKLRRRVEDSIKDGTATESIYKHFLLNREEYEVSDEEAGFVFESMIGAGARSPHNALLTFLYLMMEHPDWLARLQQQVDQVVGKDRLPTFEDIPNLPVVRAIVKEGVRYRTCMAELGIPHQLEEDDWYDGYFFEKGTAFHANYSAILMDKEVYPDGKLFNPARWLEPSYPTYKEPLSIHPNCQGFTPFGYGRRACPGYDFAERTLVIMVAMLGWAVDIKRPLDENGKEVREEMTYEPVPNPKPAPFRCRISVRDEARLSVVDKEARPGAKG